MEYRIVYSNRKTISITFDGCTPVIKVPIGTKKKTIEEILQKYSGWIEKHYEIQKKKEAKYASLTEEEIKRLKKEARKYFVDKTDYFSKIMNIDYGRITITSARKRFGSCSSAGNISFSYRLMLYPEEARDYVVVHELAHRKQMNHSKEFYAIVASVLPDYKKRMRLLKQV